MININQINAANNNNNEPNNVINDIREQNLEIERLRS